jgi:hypothetical protein
MLVQLSPWETSGTSIRVPNASRRRRRSKDNKADASTPSFAASMITMASKRSLSKMKVHSAEFADCLPLMTVTADHNITVLGKNLTEKEGEPSYREFSSLRYSSRPGEAGSFFPKSSKGSDLPFIPAILDTKNDRVYALQQGNKRLTCWNSWKGSGPDEKTALKIQLDYPVVSMTLLPMNKGIIYGSCQNGFIFVARIVGDALSVEYLQVKQPDRCVHIGTFAEIDVDQARGSGRKRKMSDADGNSYVKFYQVFCDGKSIKLMRNSVTLSTSNSDKLIKTGSLIQNAASVDLVGEEAGDQYMLTRAELLVSSSGSTPKISVVYTVSNSSSKNGESHDPYCGSFCVAISLSSGDISNSSIGLPSESKQFGLITESVLAVACNNTIHLYDVITGATLQSIALKDIVDDMDDDGTWLLETNVKHGTICVFYPKEGHLHVAMSIASLDESKGALWSNRLMSSSKLACSLLACPKGISQPTASTFNMTSSTGVERGENGVLALLRLDNAVTKALTSLEETRQSIISQGDKSSSKISFRYAFCDAVSNLMKDVECSNETIDTHESNDEPQTPTKKMKNGKLNGVSSPSPPPSSSNKFKGGKIPSCIPQSFIDGSVQIALAAFTTDKTDTANGSSALKKLGFDARLVLKELVQSRRVSARLHLEGVYALQETGKKHPLRIALGLMECSAKNSPLSPLQLILKMITHCSDLSERQLVIMLDYMMRHAKADDIVKIVHCKDVQSIPKELLLATGDEKKTILAGVKVVLQMIVGYSECNEAMLRAALVEELTSSAEAVILARLLPELLISNPDGNRSEHLVRSACQWIGALSESFRDDLSWARKSSGENYLSFLLKSVEETTKISQEIMSLKDSIGVAEMINKYKMMQAKQVASEAADELLGYSIDRIAF